MEDLFTRYLNGQFGDVVGELYSLGAAVREQPVYSQAVNVAKAFVQRSYDNLRTLHNTLTTLGYEFSRPESVLVEATSKDKDALDELERRIGQLPILARTWYEHIACVDFRQDETQLYASIDHSSPVSSNVAGLGYNCVLVFLRISECLELREDLFEDAGPDIYSRHKEEIFLPFGSFASNSEPKGLWLPNGGFDGVFYNDGGGDVSFADELRKAFACGGFPFWIATKKRRFLSPLGNIADFRALLPILAEGIQPL